MDDNKLVVDAESRVLSAPKPITVRDERKLTARDAEDMEKRVQIIARFRRAVVGMTVQKQWADFNNAPHMEADAAYVIAEAFGCTICGPGPLGNGILPAPEFEEIQISGGAVQMICRIRVFSGNPDDPDRQVFEEGECDSFDSYLMGRKSELKKGGATEEQVAELIKPRIRKKALANAVSRGVSGFTGLRGMSWDDLRQLGLSADGASANVAFKKGSSGGKTATVANIAQIGELTVGSVVSLLAEISGKPRGFNKFCLIPVKDATGQIELQTWKPASDLPKWVKPGAWLFAKTVTIGEYNGRRQYVCEGTEKAEPPADWKVSEPPPEIPPDSELEN